MSRKYWQNEESEIAQLQELVQLGSSAGDALNQPSFIEMLKVLLQWDWKVKSSWFMTLKKIQKLNLYYNLINDTHFQSAQSFMHKCTLLQV